MTKIRFFILLLISVITCSLLLSFFVLAAPSGTCGDTISYTVTNGALVLKGTGSIADYTPGTIPWLDEASAITSLTIPDGITVIGVNAFLNLSVTKVIVPESILLISDYALGFTYEEGTYTAIEGFTIVGKSGSTAETYATENGFIFEATEEPLPSGSCGQNAFWELSTDGVLTISGSGAMANYSSSSSAPWSDYITGKDDLRIASIVIAPGITTIGNYAFADCRRLASVSLPSGLTAIGVSAFSGCSDLTTLTVPGSVTTIGKLAFSSCTSLTDVILQAGIVTIDNEAFSLSAITSLTLPGSLTQIGDKAFYGCSSLASANMPGVTKLGGRAFEGCSSLSAITAPSLVTIGKSAFEGCSSLRAITFPSTLTSIGSRAFYSCSALTSITIPNSVNRLGEYAFYDAGLTTATLGNGITEIEEGTFENCTSLSSVTLSNKITTIGERAFTGCASLTSILLPASVRSIADKSLGYFYHEEDGSYEKFANFTLEILSYIPSASKLYAEQHGFTFTSLGVIDIDGGNASDTVTWSINTETGVLMINGSGAIPDYAVFSDTPWFLYANYIKTVVIGTGITGVGSSCFEDCSTVTSLTLSNTVITIGDYAFAGTSIDKLTLPVNVTTIGDSAFEGCSALKSVSLPEKLDTIGQAAFRAPNALTSMYIPESVTYIGANAIGVTEGNAPIYNFIIKGKAGTTAEDYAEHNGITFRQDGFVEITDKDSGATVTIIGDESQKFNLTMQKISDSLSPAILLAGNEYALLYDILLMNGDEEMIVEGGASIRFPIPSGVNSLAAKIFAYDENGIFTEIDATVEDGFFVFRYHTLGKFIITNADLNHLITITVYHLFTDGSEASPAELILATLGANYKVKPVTLEGYKADNNTLSGKVEGSFTLTFTYHAAIINDTTDGESEQTTDPVSPPKAPPSAKQIWLIVLEVILVLALLAAIVALILLNTKKKKEANEKDALTAAAVKKGVFADKFADTIVVPEAPTQEIDIQSLFADEPEEDTVAIEELMKKTADMKNSSEKNHHQK